MDVHEEFALDILGCKAAEASNNMSAALAAQTVALQDVLDLVEDNAAGLVYSEQAHDASHKHKHAQQLPVGEGQVEDVMIFDPLRRVAC